MSNPTRTTNKLHFEDLDPHRFEDLAYEILYRQQKWYRIDNWGRSGADDGIDVYCEDLKGQKWFCQCKRYKSISSEQVKYVVDKIVLNNENTKGGIILLVVACNVSKAITEVFKAYSIEKEIKDAQIWTSTRLEAELYNKHKDLLEKYFGCSSNKEQEEREKRIIDNHKIKKDAEKKLLRYKITHDIKYAQEIVKDPTLKFIYDAAIIRSVEDTQTYPDEGKTAAGFSNWSKKFFYNLTIDGIEFLDAPYIDVRVAVNKNNRSWRKLDKNEYPSDDEIVINTDYVGLLPYHSIVLINEEGDEYYPIPHIYCRFEFDGRPYSKCYLKNRKLRVDFFEGKPVDIVQFHKIVEES